MVLLQRVTNQTGFTMSSETDSWLVYILEREGKKAGTNPTGIMV